MAEQIVSPEPGVQIAVNDFGDPAGKTIVQIHGMIASIRDTHLFGKLTTNGFRVIAIARPGYGRSSAYEPRSILEWALPVQKVLDSIGVADYSVFGISSGAPYSYAMAYRNRKIRNVYVLSGTPALYLPDVRELWPYPLDTAATIAGLKIIARDLFFGNNYVPDEQAADMYDSYQNDCFGIALDLYLRARDWGFILEDIESSCFLGHSRDDGSVPFACAEKTAARLKNGKLYARGGDHFSGEILDRFIEEVILNNEL
ncbi:MAG: alpha/beta hydrolase [Spirochaetales bacterium]|nr:alpha/beta hydrolase [Spirochaetales bacterium]